ncbi:hypothetical protein [Saccharopolyspora cebuensis]|uniref:Small secreted domain n=1 Tax=Saccharopolyspora cebuensis TaxID=418759 RepID=A0ABV4CE92_9PSEU
MRTTARIAGVAAGAASLLAVASPAFADSIGNDGINAVNDNNINAVPINACGNNIAALIGVIVPVASAQVPDCNNSPIVDHAHVD